MGIRSWGKHGSIHRSLQVLAANFVKSVDKFVRSNPELACHIDRPNVHRMMELAYHTIPLLNHISYFCELVFESAHQPLKFYLSLNHTLRSHIYAVQLVLAKDWLICLWSLWTIHIDDTESPLNRHTALVGLIRLLCGPVADTVDWSSDEFAPCLEEMTRHVHELMDGTVEERLEKCICTKVLPHQNFIQQEVKVVSFFSTKRAQIY